MRINVPRGDLARLLAQVSKVVEARNTIPIISCVRLVASDGRLTATATDLDIEARGSIAVDGDDAAFCVNARMLTDIVGKIAGETVAIAAEPGQITVTSGRSRFKLQTLPVQDFPDITAGQFGEPFKIDLAALFAPVQFAISTEETRFYLNGIYLHGNGTELTAVATDGHRLSRNRIANPADIPGVIVPRKMVGLVPKGEIGVEVSDTKIRLSSGDLVLTSKLIDGTFPDYERVIPSGNSKKVGVDRDAIMRASDRVALVSNERERGAKLTIAPGQIVLTLRGATDEASEEIAADYDGEPLDIGFNARYLSEVVSIFPAGQVCLGLEDAGAPALITADAAPGLLAVLMPRRV